MTAGGFNDEVFEILRREREAEEQSTETKKIKTISNDIGR